MHTSHENYKILLLTHFHKWLRIFYKKTSTNKNIFAFVYLVTQFQGIEGIILLILGENKSNPGPINTDIINHIYPELFINQSGDIIINIGALTENIRAISKTISIQSSSATLIWIISSGFLEQFDFEFLWSTVWVVKRFLTRLKTFM